MTRTEFAICMAALTSGTGRAFIPAMREVWWSCLKDLTVESMRYAVSRWLCERDSGFPNIAAIRQYAAQATSGHRLTAAEAWAGVLNAVRKFGHYEPAKALESLDDLTQRALRGIGGFQTVCDSEGISILSAQFRMAYEALAARAEQHARLPEELRPRIGNEPAVTALAAAMSTNHRKEITDG